MSDTFYPFGSHIESLIYDSHNVTTLIVLVGRLTSEACADDPELYKKLKAKRDEWRALFDKLKAEEDVRREAQRIADAQNERERVAAQEAGGQAFSNFLRQNQERLNVRFHEIQEDKARRLLWNEARNELMDRLNKLEQERRTQELVAELREDMQKLHLPASPTASVEKTSSTFPAQETSPIVSAEETSPEVTTTQEAASQTSDQEASFDTPSGTNTFDDEDDWVIVGIDSKDEDNVEVIEKPTKEETEQNGAPRKWFSWFYR